MEEFISALTLKIEESFVTDEYVIVLADTNTRGGNTAKVLSFVDYRHITTYLHFVSNPLYEGTKCLNYLGYEEYATTE